MSIVRPKKLCPRCQLRHASHTYGICPQCRNVENLRRKRTRKD